MSVGLGSTGCGSDGVHVGVRGGVGVRVGRRVAVRVAVGVQLGGGVSVTRTPTAPADGTGLRVAVGEKVHVGWGDASLPRARAWGASNPSVGVGESTKKAA